MRTFAEIGERYAQRIPLYGSGGQSGVREDMRLFAELCAALARLEYNIAAQLTMGDTRHLVRRPSEEMTHSLIESRVQQLRAEIPPAPPLPKCNCTAQGSAYSSGCPVHDPGSVPCG